MRLHYCKFKFVGSIFKRAFCTARSHWNDQLCCTVCTRTTNTQSLQLQFTVISCIITFCIRVIRARGRVEMMWLSSICTCDLIKSKSTSRVSKCCWQFSETPMSSFHRSVISATVTLLMTSVTPLTVQTHMDPACCAHKHTDKAYLVCCLSLVDCECLLLESSGYISNTNPVCFFKCLLDMLTTKCMKNSFLFSILVKGTLINLIS